MDITPSTVALVTGTNRGLGRTLVEALLDRGVGRVYASARDVDALEPIFGHDDRVVTVQLDVTDSRHIAAAAQTAGDVNLLVNNASFAAFARPLEADAAAIDAEMAVNYRGTFALTRAFIPVLERNGGGAVVNVLTLLSLASTPGMAGYSASKAAAHSMTQALRTALTGQGITVHGVYPGAIDTDMIAEIQMPKTPPRVVADAVLDGVAAGAEDIFPDPMAQQMAALWWNDPKSFERQFAAL